MSDVDLQKLSDKDYQSAKQNFLRKTSQSAREQRLSRLAEHRDNAKEQDFKKMGFMEFENAKQKFFRTLR